MGYCVSRVHGPWTGFVFKDAGPLFMKGNPTGLGRGDVEDDSAVTWLTALNPKPSTLNPIS